MILRDIFALSAFLLAGKGQACKKSGHHANGYGAGKPIAKPQYTAKSTQRSAYQYSTNDKVGHAVLPSYGLRPC